MVRAPFRDSKLLQIDGVNFYFYSSINQRLAVAARFGVARAGAQAIGHFAQPFGLVSASFFHIPDVTRRNRKRLASRQTNFENELY